MAREAAVAEPTFRVCNVTPDICILGKHLVIPFDITQVLQPEFSGYSSNVFGRDKKCLMSESIVKGTIGHLGKGIVSGVGQGSGHTRIVHGDPTVLVNGRELARHLDPCEMNTAG